MTVLLISSYIDTSGYHPAYNSIFPQLINSAAMLVGTFITAIVVAVEFIDMKMLKY
jgi:hypothetical protein